MITKWIGYGVLFTAIAVLGLELSLFGGDQPMIELSGDAKVYIVILTCSVGIIGGMLAVVSSYHRGKNSHRH